MPVDGPARHSTRRKVEDHGGTRRREDLALRAQRIHSSFVALDGPPMVLLFVTVAAPPAAQGGPLWRGRYQPSAPVGSGLPRLRLVVSLPMMPDRALSAWTSSPTTCCDAALHTPSRPAAVSRRCNPATPGRDLNAARRDRFHVTHRSRRQLLVGDDDRQVQPECSGNTRSTPSPLLILRREDDMKPRGRRPT